MQAPSTFSQPSQPCLFYPGDLGESPVAPKAAHLITTGLHCAPRGQQLLLPSLSFPPIPHRRLFPSSYRHIPHEPPLRRRTPWTKSITFSLTTLLTWVFAMRLSIPTCLPPTTCWSIPRNTSSSQRRMALKRTTLQSSTPTV